MADLPDALEATAGEESMAMDVAEKQILVECEEEDYPWMQVLLFRRLEAGKWTGVTPRGVLRVFDLANRAVVPLIRNAEMPDEERPYLIFDNDITVEQLDSLRRRAVAFAELQGLADATGAAGTACWRYEDTAHELFGTAVPPALLADQARLELKANSGLLREDDDDGVEVWTFIQRVEDEEPWSWEKRMGGGRHRLLSGVKPRKRGQPILFADAASCFDLTAKADPELFIPMARDENPLAIREVTRGIVRSNKEIQQFFSTYLGSSGLNPKGSTAHEMFNILVTFGLMACLDGADLYHSAAAEHLARRYLQCQRAVRKSP